MDSIVNILTGAVAFLAITVGGFFGVVAPQIPATPAEVSIVETTVEPIISGGGSAGLMP